MRSQKNAVKLWIFMAISNKSKESKFILNTRKSYNLQKK